MKLNRTTLEATLRAHVAQGHCDRIIATMLGVSLSTITYWRRHYGIRPTDKFVANFQRVYGRDAVEAFAALVQARATCAAIGTAFGFTREYARQVYHKLRARGLCPAHVDWKAGTHWTRREVRHG